MKQITLALIMLCALAGNAQTGAIVNVRFNVKADTLVQNEYPVPEKDAATATKTLVLPMNYNESAIKNAEAAEVLNSGLCNVVSIDLVYTDDGNEDLLERLNKRRLFELYMVAPDVFNRTMVKWRFIKQTGEGHNVRKMFHGFVIRYRLMEPYRPPSLAVFKEDVEKIAAKPFDHDLFRVLKRIPNVEQQAIAVDFTGSMSPYYKELMAWFFLKKYGQATGFVFFNDGNDLKDRLKVAGKTGGLYSFRTDNLDTILAQALKSVAAGNGGDSPENDVEAVLQAIKDNPKAKEIVLIADNWADMRDYSLISSVKKPVHIILCGTEEGINTQYLDFAKITKGSVHTIEEDIDNLSKVSEGHEVKIGKDTYLYSGGRFRKK